MMQVSNSMEHDAELFEKPVKDEGSTTEEEESTSTTDLATSEDSEKEVSSFLDPEEQLAIMMQQKQVALQFYGERFGVDRTGTKMFGMQTHWNGSSPEEETVSTATPVETVLADMDHDLKAEARDKDSKEGVQEVSARSNHSAATFGYAGSLDENPPFAKFDIRDSVCMKVGGFKHGQVVCDRNGAEFIAVGVRFADGAKRLWFQPKSLDRPGAGAFQDRKMRLTLVPGAHVALREMKPEDFDEGEYSDGEEVALCNHCHLPIGHHCYKQGNAKGLVHAECLAQSMSNIINEKEQSRKQEEDEMKRKVRAEYSIGWRAEEVPRNMTTALQLGCENPPEGMCALAYDEKTHCVQVAPTLEPAESVNLEYLALALQVRSQEGKEPLFSLDPVDAQDDQKKDSMHEKRYEPEWLAGTSVGEVLFQADYHLKELSLGEHQQPVIGMKNCNDLCDEEKDDEWTGREWFVVKKAEVQMTEANILVPRVKMGVEARELVLTQDGLLDKPVTRPDHPLVKYAEQFTHYFDLIAERKSAIYHLRDLAKASILARMLIETGVNLQESWFNVAEAREVDSLEVPQLWNMRVHSHIEVNDSKVVTAAEKNRSRGIYGGVDFGLSAQAITVPTTLAKAGLSAASIASTRIGVGTTALSSMPVGAAPSVALSAVMTAAAPVPFAIGKPRLGLISVTEPPPKLVGGIHTGLANYRDLLVKPHLRTPVMPGTLPVKPSTPLASRGELQADMIKLIPQGVDLNLDEFNVSKVTRTTGQDWTEAVDVKSAAVGDMFWSIVDDDACSIFQSKDQTLLKAIFDPTLSDRREEGAQFVPPETGFAYVQRLRALVQEEEALRRQRKDHFLSSDFSLAKPGPLFPQAWAAPVEITTGKGTKLHLRPDYKQQSHKLEAFVKSTTPAFDKSSEDGARFRIYHIGNLEVRTIQVPSHEEVIGAVYSKCAPVQGKKIIAQDEKVKKVTELVEKSHNARCSYVVLETEQGNTIMSERLLDGSLTWEENSADLEDRTALAKVVRSAVCSKDEITVAHMKSYQNSYVQKHFESGSARSACKSYAQAFFVEAAADNTSLQSGFRKPRSGDKWQISEHDEAKMTVQEGKRPNVGDKVQVRETGRVGQISSDDHSALPFKVCFPDGEFPLSKWYSESDLQRLDDEC